MVHERGCFQPASTANLHLNVNMAARFKALIFDMDGTLVDSERVHRQAWGAALRAHQMAVPDFQVFSKYVGVSDEQMADDFIEAANPRIGRAGLVASKCGAYLNLVPQIRLLPGVEDVLRRCRGRYRMAVASSSPSTELAAILKHHALLHYFEYVAGGDMVERKKPDPEIYRLVTVNLGLAPAECVAFEDSQTGIAAARAAGLKAVAVPHAMSAGHDFSRADALLSNLGEVDDRLLEKLAGGAA